MNTTQRSPASRSRGLFPILGAAALAGIIGLTGCDVDSILEVDDPDTAQLEDIEDEENLPVFRAHAIGEFQVGYAGRGAAQDNAFILMSGLLSDEYEASGTFPTRVEVDQRNIQISNATTQTTYRLMHRARVAALRADRAFELHDPGAPGQAEMRNLAGLMYNAFGEMYCSGQPFSELVPPADFEYGEPLTTEETFHEARGWFADARSTAAASGAIQEEYTAAVGEARALLNLGEFADAAAAVSDVPTDFEYVVHHDGATARQWNGMWNFINNVQRWRIPDQAGGNGLPYRSDGTETDPAGNIMVDGDPRIIWYEAGPAFDAGVTQYSQLRYDSRETPTPVVSGIEARLIEAEAALNAEDEGTFLQIHNELRATMDGLDPFTDEDLAGLDFDGLVDLHFQERAYWLWQTGHRLGDLRRLVRDYGRDTEEVFPSGEYHKGGGFGSDVNFPIPVDEENNPNFETCFDRDA